MALRLSTAARNFLNSGGSVRQMLQGGRIEVYSGTQPAGGDSAVSGTLLGTYTRASGAWTAETRSAGTVTLNSGSAGSVDAITIDGVSVLDTVVPYNTSLTQTAADVAAAVNRTLTNTDWVATSSGAVITFTAKPGLGTRYNGKTLTSTVTTLTKTDVNPSGGVVSANGIRYDVAAGGAIALRSSDVVTCVAVAGGTAGWFRHYGPNTDAGAADGSFIYNRLDGSIATSGAQINMNPTLWVAGATQTLSTFAPTIPASL